MILSDALIDFAYIAASNRAGDEVTN